eukprot:TRINITY_DN319_c0_g1_i1.p1 TRINITY_DN319_c0_g1~~TRINITY_DN319_c0_g1_i1.p1  ORF type:complete len:697 (-),score=165.37 TRINITY_DN319_c0_g1_i1:1149-3239(-)
MAFWKPGTAGPGLELAVHDRECEKENDYYVYNPWARLSISQQRVRLPIFQCRSQLLYCLEKCAVVVIIGETGCGKTTQIPQYLLEAGWTEGGRMVCCTQPRRIAATSVAQRVASEMGCQLGQEVGYAIRFEDCCSAATKIKYVTDGMLVRETMLDPLLSRYSAIMLDEVHERSLYTDILLGLLKKIRRKRPDLRLVVASATLNAEQIRDFFETNTTSDRTKDTTCILSIEGRTFPVTTFYAEQPVSDYMEAALSAVLEIHGQEPAGDVLVFLTGQEEIDKMVELIHERAAALPNTRDKRGPPPNPLQPASIRALPMYAGLTSEQQNRVFQPLRQGVRKVVVATNIAETSITIEGIVYVIDPGFVKLRTFNGRTGMDALVVTPVSQASANQRMGRAGRTKPGKCFRLYTEDSFYATLQFGTVPEIQRSNLSSLVLQLKALGIDDIVHFDFISSPPYENLAHSLELLYALGAIDSNCRLTEPLGLQMAEFPVDPTLAKMILSSSSYNCGEEIVTIAAMLSVQNVFPQSENRVAVDRVRRGFAVYEGDHLTLLNVFNMFQLHAKDVKSWCSEKLISYRVMLKAVQVRSQLLKYARRFKVELQRSDGDATCIRKCIVSGFFCNAAQRQGDGSYRSIRGDRTLYVHPWSIVYSQPPDWVVFHELVLTTKPYMRDVTAIDPQWLYDIAPHYFRLSKNIRKLL